MKILSIILIISIYTTVNSTISYLSVNEEPFTSIYEEEETGPRLDNLSIQFQYGIPTSMVTTFTSIGTVTSSNSIAVISSGSSAGTTYMQSNNAIQYRAGHEIYCYFSAAFTGNKVASTTQYMGIFDENNGFAVGFNGTTFGILYRNSSSGSLVTTTITQSNFNIDKINGTGPSQFTYNPSLFNVFRISYGWLGGSIARFEIMNSNGNWIPFHIIENPNSLSNPSLSNGMLPMRAEIVDSVGASGVVVRTGGWNMGIIGATSYITNQGFGLYVSKTTPGTTETHLFTLLNSATFQGKPNKINVIITFLSSCVQPGGTNNQYILNIYKNATVTGTSFSDVSTGNSVVQFSTAGTYTASTALQLLPAFGQPTAQQTVPLLPASFNIVIFPGETCTVTILPFSASGAIGVPTETSISWLELK